MAVYNPTTEDLESGLGARPRLTVVREAAKGDWKWKLCGLLSLVALCAAAGLLFFAWRVQNQEHLHVERPAERHEGQPEESGHHHMLQQLAGKSTSAIHLEGDWKPERYSASIWWRDSVGHSFTQGDLSLKDNQIVINTSGLYFVYSQASFRVKCDPMGSARDQMYNHLFHNVWRFSESYDDKKTLLGTIKTACADAKPGADSSGRIFSTIYLGAVFQLEKDDRLWTETNHLTDIEVDGGKTFFGVFAL
ncbi:Tumor necrosis factor-like [Scleropages formosus]|uniref:Tumor necrosis factor n=1 Tax=Scleropages formosus TaxID=113540 RepID=A0A0P7X9K0_SCLFO|nr:Tumor necrosis factor-like [Scleropages formosus]